MSNTRHTRKPDGKTTPGSHRGPFISTSRLAEVLTVDDLPLTTAPQVTVQVLDSVDKPLENIMLYHYVDDYMRGYAQTDKQGKVVFNAAPFSIMRAVLSVSHFAEEPKKDIQAIGSFFQNVPPDAQVILRLTPEQEELILPLSAMPGAKRSERFGQ